MPIQTPVVGTTSVRNKVTFSKRQLTIIAATLGVIGIIALIASFALTPENGDFEAETMTVQAL